MITGELLRACVQQAWDSGCGGGPFTYSPTAAWNSNGSSSSGSSGGGGGCSGSGGWRSASHCSPLDCPELIMSYYNASRDALLRHHCDIPMLQPRATYAMPRRPSPASVGRSRTHHFPHHPPPPSYPRGAVPHIVRAVSRRSSQSTAAPSMSPPYARHSREEAPSPSAEIYRAAGGRFSGLRGPTVMTGRNARGWRDEGDGDRNSEDPYGDRGGGDGAGSSHRHYDAYDADLLADGRPSWTPRPTRRRPAARPTARRSASGSAAPLDPLTYAEDADGMEAFGEVEAESRAMPRPNARATEPREHYAPTPRGSVLYQPHHHHHLHLHHHHHHHHHHHLHHHHWHHSNHHYQLQRHSQQRWSSGPIGRENDDDEAQRVDVHEWNEDESSCVASPANLQMTMRQSKRMDD